MPKCVNINDNFPQNNEAKRRQRGDEEDDTIEHANDKCHMRLHKRSTLSVIGVT